MERHTANSNYCETPSGRKIRGGQELRAKHSQARSNKAGYCLAPTCTHVQESLVYILLTCPSYNPVRDKLRAIRLGCRVPYLKELLVTVIDGKTYCHNQELNRVAFTKPKHLLQPRAFVSSIVNSYEMLNEFS